MPKFELVLRNEGKPSQRFEVPARGLFIGRNEDNDIPIYDQLVSRRHARLWMEGDTLRIEDLGSRNGVEVNGTFVTQGALRAGDVVQIGAAIFHVARAHESKLGSTVISHENASSLYQSMVNDTKDARLPVLYRAAQLLGSVFDQDVLSKKILGVIFEALPVQRGFVFLRHRGAGDAEVLASLSREQGDEGPPLSHTLIKHVFKTREAMLTLDAQVDARFEHAESIMGHGIHSAMCAPLCGRQDVVGALYVDSGSTPRAYSREDLEMLTAIARVVGVAVENARLYRENVHQERLAAIGEATAGVGHCVKNILTGIRGGGEFISMGLDRGDWKYVEKGWPILHRSAERIEALVMNMLSFSKERLPERLACDLNSLIREVLEGLQERAQRAGVSLRFNGNASQRAEVDQREIYRVLMNLLINAIEACTSGGVVEVTCSSDEEGCYVKITDDGCGIPAEMLPRLSQAFVSTKGSAGTGLGLACSYKIVREHGGDIRVESKEGKGTAFTIFLPHLTTVSRPTDEIRLAIG